MYKDIVTTQQSDKIIISTDKTGNHYQIDVTKSLKGRSIRITKKLG